jgi:predicted Zn-dependent protease
MRPDRRPHRAFLAAAVSCGVACASTLQQQVETTAAKALISPEQAKQIGDQLKQELQKQGVQFVSDPTVDGWVAKVSDPLFVVARKARSDIQEWRVHVINDPRTVNAFATTSGDLYVYSGLIQLADDGAELAGVLSHEIGHVALYHVQRQMVDAVGLEALTALALGKSPGTASQIAAGLAGKGAMLANSRGDEKQADDWGVVHADEAGYDPNGLVRFFEKLKAQEGNQPQALAWLSDHPSTPSRIDDIQQIIRDKNLHATGKGPSGLDEVKAALAKIPPSPPPKGAPAAGGNPSGAGGQGGAGKTGGGR